MSRSERAPVLGAHTQSDLKVNANQWTTITNSAPDQAKPFLPYLTLALAAATAWQIVVRFWPIVVCNDQAYIDRFPFVSGKAAINSHIIVVTALTVYLWLWGYLQNKHPQAAYTIGQGLLAATIITGLICNVPTDKHPVSDQWHGSNPYVPWTLTSLTVILTVYMMIRGKFMQFWSIVFVVSFGVGSIIGNFMLPNDDQFLQDNDLQTNSKSFTLAC